MSIIGNILKWFSYPTQRKIMKSCARVYVKGWPFAVDICREAKFKLQTPEYLETLKHLKVGDIILRTYENFSSNWFIPGKYTHAGVYIGRYGDIEHAIIHMVDPHTTLDTVAAYMACDGIQVWRKKGELSDVEVQSVIEYGITYLQKKVEYDYEFLITESEEVRKNKHKMDSQENADRRMYCMEGCVRMYQDVKDVEFFIADSYGSALYVPETAVSNSKGLELIYEK
jgi:hypothetical protein